MNFIKRFLAFWYDFIVGDDWVVAAGVDGSALLVGTGRDDGLTVARRARATSLVCAGRTRSLRSRPTSTISQPSLWDKER